MKTQAARTKQSVAVLLAIGISCIFQPTLTALNAIPDSNRQSEWRADAIDQAGTSAPALAAADSATRLKLGEAYGRAPLSFEANGDQTDDARVKFLSRGDGYNVFLTSTEATFAFFKTQRLGPASANKEKPGSMRGPIYSQSQADNNRAAALRIRLQGANKAAKLKRADELPGRNNYFIGSDPKKWRANVPTYSRVEYESIYRGVDLVYYGDQRQLEYDFIVAPGASYKIIRIRFEGGDRVSLDDAGDLVIETGGRKVYQRRPVVYQEVNGIREPIAARYIVSGRREVGFEIGAYDANRSLIIDPVFSYSTYLGNAALSSVAVDPNRSAYVTGTLSLDDFGRSFDAFVMKLNREGTAVLYSTFLGGSDRMITEGIQNRAFDIAVDSNGNAYVTGSTGSKDFPTTPGAFQTTLPGTTPGRRSAFVTKLNSTGDALVYSTYLGGTDNFSQSSGQAIAVDEAGSAYVTGSTDSFKFPVVNPIQSINRGGVCSGDDFFFPCPFDAFVSKLNPSGTGLVYSTYLGGEGIDSGGDIVVDSAGFAYVVGTTSAFGFPTKNPLQPLNGGSNDVFITKLSADGNELIYSTLFGGSGNDNAHGVGVDSSGNVYITGSTSSTDFPTTPGALQAANSSSTVFKSTDGGTTWSPINRGLPGSDSPVRQLVIDPISSTLYANAAKGIFKSSDGGNSWRRLIPSNFVDIFAVDPTNPLVMYAEVFFAPAGDRLEKTTDGGKTWSLTGSGLDFQFSPTILVDPQNPATLYVAAQISFEGRLTAGVFKSTDAGANFVPSGRGIDSHQSPPSSLALDPRRSRKLYAVSGNCVFKSTNSGKRWRPTGFCSAPSFISSLVTDPVSAGIIYLATSSGVLKSTDGGFGWAKTGLTASVSLLAIDPKNTSIVYAGSSQAGSDRLFKSTDGGASWRAIGAGITGSLLATIAIDPNNTSVIYAGTFTAPNTDAFVAKIDPTGTAVVYSTYLGGAGDDISRAIEVDAQGNAYLTGQTASDNFPSKSAIQQRKLGSPGNYDAFLTKLDPSGDLIYSSYLGGSSNDDGRAIALDDAGGLYIVGSTDSDDFPTVNPIQGTRNGRFGVGFVTKVVDAASNGGAFSQARALVRFEFPRRFVCR